MLIGQSIIVPAAGTPGAIYYSPWMPHQGNGCTTVFQVLKQSASGWNLKVEVFTKNQEDPDSAETNLGSVTISTVSTQTLPVTGCLELIRYKYSVTGFGTEYWVHFRANPPIWQPN